MAVFMGSWGLRGCSRKKSGGLDYLPRNFDEEMVQKMTGSNKIIQVETHIFTQKDPDVFHPQNLTNRY